MTHYSSLNPSIRPVKAYARDGSTLTALVTRIMRQVNNTGHTWTGTRDKFHRWAERSIATDLRAFADQVCVKEPK